MGEPGGGDFHLPPPEIALRFRPPHNPPSPRLRRASVQILRSCVSSEGGGGSRWCQDRTDSILMRYLDVCMAVIVATLSVTDRPTLGADLPSPVPRFASLSRDNVFMRQGPDYRQRILWVYHRKGLPVEIVGLFDVWRHVRDSEGTTGWVHSSMIAETRTVLVTAKKPVPIYRGN